MKRWAKPCSSASWGSKFSGGEGKGRLGCPSRKEEKGNGKCFLVVSPARARRAWGRECHSWEAGEGGLWCSPPSRRSKRWGKVRDEDGWRERFITDGAKKELVEGSQQRRVNICHTPQASTQLRFYTQHQSIRLWERKEPAWQMNLVLNPKSSG